MRNQKKLSRRRFIIDSAITASLLASSGFLTSCSLFSGKNGRKYKIPRRRLGKTGLEVSILAFGGGSQFLQNNDGEWEKLLETAVEGGIKIENIAESGLIDFQQLQPVWQL